MAKKKKKKARKTSRTRKPEGMSLEQWQTALRREFGREQDFKLTNQGDHPVFSEFTVHNPKSNGEYRVAIRGRNPGDNFCSCPDFSVNTLGTCKHIEFTIARLERKRGGKKKLDAGYHPPFSEIYLRYGGKREIAFRPGAECPVEIKRFASRYFNKDGILSGDGYSKFDQFLKGLEKKRNGHTIRCYPDSLEFVAQVRDQARLNQSIQKAFPKGENSTAFKKLLKISLYPYQRRGSLFAAQAGRSLIADDMGLGKTIQAIAASEILAQHAGVEKVLVVSPTSLKHQWRMEVERFTNRKAEVVEGGIAQRKDMYLGSDAFYLMTNYDVIHRDLPAIQTWNPDLIILDEAQRIKNWKTKTAQSVKRLNSKYCIVLTGTPLENRLEELHSIVEFVDMHRLGPLFKYLHEHQLLDDGGKVVGYRNLKKIGRTLEPVLLRRTKDEVLKELPERLEKRFFVSMTEEQMNYHEENRVIVARIVMKWRRQGFLTDSDQRRLTCALQNMRMSCNSTWLLDQKTDFGYKVDELMQLLDEMLEDQNAKVVVFSQWFRTHELITTRLNTKNHPYILFHGGVPSKKRKDLISRFKEDLKCRVFLSTDAGGVGLNLQNASAVVNMDLPWNPAVLEQRIGRVHRLGQKRPVRVVNFVAKGTIEEGMLSLLSFKKSMFSGVLDGGENEVFLGGTRLKKFMDSVDTVTGSIPESAPVTAEDVRDAGEAREEGPITESADETDPWNELISAGMSFVEKLTATLSDTKTAKGQKKKTIDPQAFIRKDPKTGEPFLRFPMPRPETIQKIADLVNSFAGK